MPRPLFFSSLALIVAGVAGILSSMIFPVSTTAFVYFGFACSISGGALLFGLSWGRSLASILIFVGYLTAAIYLVSGLGPSTKGGIEVWQRFGVTFLGVAVLTSIYGSLWSKSVSMYLDRGNATKIPK
jgi:hypothetical protein